MLLNQIGKSENKIVVSGVFKFYETHGLPLSDILFGINNKNGLPDFLSFYIEARNAGMKHSRVLSILEEGLNDSTVYPNESITIILERLKSLNDK